MQERLRMFGRMMDWFDRLVEQHKFFRRAAITVSLGICAWTTYQMFTDIEKITSAAAMAYATATGLLGLTTKWYFDLRNQDGK